MAAVKPFAVTAWQRLTANRWTVVFVSALIVQAVAQALIQMEAYKTNLFGINILNGLADAENLPQALTRPTSQAVTASLDGEKQEEIKEEEEESDSSSSESSGSDDDDEEEESSSDRESSDEEEEPAQVNSGLVASKSGDVTSSKIKGGASTPTGISPPSTPLNTLRQFKNKFAQQISTTQLGSSSSSVSNTPATWSRVTSKASSRNRAHATSARKTKSRQASAASLDFSNNERNTKSLVTDSPNESSGESDVEGLFNDQESDESDDEHPSSLKLSPHTKRPYRIRRFGKRAEPGLNLKRQLWHRAVAAPPPSMNPPIPLASYGMRPVSSSAAQTAATKYLQSSLASNLILAPTPTRMPIVAKGVDLHNFHIYGVFASSAANGTTKLFGISEDSSRPSLITPECAASLIKPLTMLERQGTQAITLAFFDLWLLLLALFGLYKQSVPHLPAVWVSKLAAVVFSTVQVVQIQQFHVNFHRDVVRGSCEEALILPGYWSKMLHLSIAGMALEIAFFILFTVFLWALYKFIKWQSFRLLGADRRSSIRYAIHMIHSIIVFTSAFFILAFYALLLHELVIQDRPKAWKMAVSSQGISKAFVAVLGAVTALSPFWLLSSYFSASRRSLPMLAVFALGAMGVLGTAVFFIQAAPASTNSLVQRWTFFIFLSVFAVLSFSATCIATMLVYFYESKFLRERNLPLPSKGLEWAAESPKAGKVINDEFAADTPKDPEPYDPHKSQEENNHHIEAEEAPKYQNRMDSNGKGQSIVVDPASEIVSSSPAATHDGPGLQHDNGRPEPIDYPNASLDSKNHSSPAISGLSAQERPSRFSMTSEATTTLTQTTATSSETQVLVVPVRHKSADVLILQSPGRREVSKWSATVTSTDGRSSWLPGDDTKI